MIVDAERVPPSMARRIKWIRRNNAFMDNAKAELAAGSKTEFLATTDMLAIDSLLEAVEHVIEVLREAQKNNGGYGFVRQLLEYLGAEEGQG